MKPNSAWVSWAGGLLAVGLAVAALLQIREGFDEAVALIGRMSPAVWISFAALCLVQPVADMAIFRGLWRLPYRGFPVILRKVVINEVLFGYSGELYFYLWARRQPGLSDAPFGAIKDVNILSALGGNVLTLVMLPIGALALARADLAGKFGPALWPGVAVVVLSFGILFFSRRVFSLARRELRFVAAIHAARLLANNGLTLLVWRLSLPDVHMGVWLALLTGRLLLARLPFVTNRELVFANLVLVLFGAGAPTALLLATLAIATLMAHAVLTVLVSAPGLLVMVGRALRPLRSGAPG